MELPALCAAMCTLKKTAPATAAAPKRLAPRCRDSDLTPKQPGHIGRAVLLLGVPTGNRTQIASSTNSSVNRYTISTMNLCNILRMEEKCDCDNRIRRQELQPLKPVALAVFGDRVGDEHAKDNRRELEGVKHQVHMGREEV